MKYVKKKEIFLTHSKGKLIQHLRVSMQINRLK